MSTCIYIYIYIYICTCIYILQMAFASHTTWKRRELTAHSTTPPPCLLSHSGHLKYMNPKGTLMEEEKSKSTMKLEDKSKSTIKLEDKSKSTTREVTAHSAHPHLSDAPTRDCDTAQNFPRKLRSNGPSRKICDKRRHLSAAKETYNAAKKPYNQPPFSKRTERMLKFSNVSSLDILHNRFISELTAEKLLHRARLWRVVLICCLGHAVSAGPAISAPAVTYTVVDAHELTRT